MYTKICYLSDTNKTVFYSLFKTGPCILPYSPLKETFSDLSSRHYSKQLINEASKETQRTLHLCWHLFFFHLTS